MSSLYTLDTLVLVLQGEREIKGLSLQDDLIAINAKGTPLGLPLSRENFMKIARLQTLKAKIEEENVIPEMDDLKEVQQVTGDNTLQAMADSLGVQEDATRRCMMIDFLIVEVVRQIFPQECDRMDVDYFLHPTEGLMYREFRRRRFLD